MQICPCPNCGRFPRMKVRVNGEGYNTTVFCCCCREFIKASAFEKLEISSQRKAIDLWNNISKEKAKLEKEKENAGI